MIAEILIDDSFNTKYKGSDMNCLENRSLNKIEPKFLFDPNAMATVIKRLFFLQ